MQHVPEYLHDVTVSASLVYMLSWMLKWESTKEITMAQKVQVS